jgi:phage tail-like protein
MPTGVRDDPYRNFRFRVEIKGITIAGFSEVTIPDNSGTPIEYREGTDDPHQKQLSGLTKYGNITLKKGITDSMDLYNWRQQIEDKGANSQDARKSISLIAIDDEGNDKARWEVFEAWPTKYSPSNFSAKGSEVLIESMDIVHEGIKRVK